MTRCAVRRGADDGVDHWGTGCKPWLADLEHEEREIGRAVIERPEPEEVQGSASRHLELRIGEQLGAYAAEINTAVRPAFGSAIGYRWCRYDR